MAIKHYYNVILHLKGINVNSVLPGMEHLLAGARSSHRPRQKLSAAESVDKVADASGNNGNETGPSQGAATSTQSTSKISEVVAEDDARPDEQEPEMNKSNAVATNKEDVVLDEKYTMAGVQKTIASVYVNMATCNAKREQWAKVLRNAQRYVSSKRAGGAPTSARW